MQYISSLRVRFIRNSCVAGMVSGVLLLSGCAVVGGGSTGRTPADGESGGGGNHGASGISQSGAQEQRGENDFRESNIVWARLPSSRPEVKIMPKSAQLFSESLVALANDNYVDAEVLLKQITLMQPELSGPWLNLGQVYLAAERTDSARGAFERAIEANPTNCAALNQLGVLARREGRLDEAENSYLACIDRDPTFPQVYLNLGILYEVYQGKLPQALEAYREYQDLQASAGQEDTRVKGWVVDLERRL